MLCALRKLRCSYENLSRACRAGLTAKTSKNSIEIFLGSHKESSTLVISNNQVIQGGNIRGLVASIIVGLIAGLVASWLMKAKTGVLVDIVLGIVGSILGGWISSLLTGVNLVSGVNLTSIVISIIGAIIVIGLYRLIKRK